MNMIMPALATLFLLAADAPATELEVLVERVRNTRGVLHFCVTANPRYFPDCSSDRSAVKKSVPAVSKAVHLGKIRPGRYAVIVFHDENHNHKLDTTLGIPREGFGFSRNPKVRFGPPLFKQVDIELRPGLARHTVRMQYIL
jgi:uncharacterized protein (DUF2141 family)